MTSDRLEEVKFEIENFRDLIVQRWLCLSEVERAAYSSGDVKLISCVVQASATLQEQQEDTKRLEIALLEVMDII